jgi:GMP synthase-like glutamine amidotransferase
VKIGILETGAPPPMLTAEFGNYGDMMCAMIGPGIQTCRFDVVANGPPTRSAANLDGYIITGSAAGVYDDLPWLTPLIAFLRQIKAEIPMVGICFGHQIMAQAFGGQVIKSPKGWGIGLHSYQVKQVEPWMDPVTDVAIPASHQDQVVVAPPNARVILASDFTPIAGLAYDGIRAASFQAHPEFSPSYAAALLEARRGTRFDGETVDAALDSLARPNDRERVAMWIRRFFTMKDGIA